jgi:hypothetical protein
MRFEGPLDETPLNLQDLFEALLIKLKHPTPAADDDDVASAYGDDTTGRILMSPRGGVNRRVLKITT